MVWYGYVNSERGRRDMGCVFPNPADLKKKCVNPTFLLIFSPRLFRPYPTHPLQPQYPTSKMYYSALLSYYQCSMKIKSHCNDENMLYKQAHEKNP